MLAKGIALATAGAASATSPSSVRASARHLADLLGPTSEVQTADEVALRAAQTASYATSVGPRPRRAAGRSLTADVLYATGVAGWLVAGPGDGQPTNDEVADALAEYLAGPSVPIWRYLGIDADLALGDGPVDIAGWQLVVLDRVQLANLLPVAPVSAHAPNRPWNPDTWSGTAFLRRVEPDARPITGLMLYFGGPYPERVAWPAMLVLSCWTNDVVTVWSDHEVEPGRHVGTRLDRVWYDTIGGEDWEIERPMTASLGVTPPKESMFRRFCAEVSALLPDPDAATWRGRALTRAAFRFLAAGEHAAVRPEPFHDERVPEAIVGYVAALEGLVAPDGASGEVARKVAQRTAVLVGRDDEDRLRTAEVLRIAYTARSRWAHGDDLRPQDTPDVAGLRDIARRAFIAWLANTAEYNGRDDLRDHCDRALLSTAARAELVAPLDALRDRVARGGPTPTALEG